MASAPTTLPSTEAIEPPPARPPSPWLWMVVACLLMAASSTVRFAQERRFGLATQDASKILFPLKDLPTALGDWAMQGPEQALDDQTLEIAGSVDYIARTYADERTGVSLQVLVVYGPAERVFPHSPTVCFPASGFAMVDGSRMHMIPTESGVAPFSSVIYAKSGVAGSRTEVFYSYWHDGRWSPFASETSKRFRHQPQMFKLQVERLVADSESRGGAGGTSPIEDFLGHLLPELERRIAAATNQNDVADPATPANADDGPTTPSSS